MKIRFGLDISLGNLGRIGIAIEEDTDNPSYSHQYNPSNFYNQERVNQDIQRATYQAHQATLLGKAITAKYN